MVVWGPWIIMPLQIIKVGISSLNVMLKLLKILVSCNFNCHLNGPTQCQTKRFLHFRLYLFASSKLLSASLFRDLKKSIFHDLYKNDEMQTQEHKELKIFTFNYEIIRNSFSKLMTVNQWKFRFSFPTHYFFQVLKKKKKN